MTTVPIGVHPMRWSYRALFLFALGFGAFLVAVGVAGLLELPIEPLREQGTTTFELVIAVVGGAAFLLFAVSGWRCARAWLDSERLAFLRFGLFCRQETVELPQIRRFGVGEEKRGYQSYHVLLLDLERGRRRSIKVSMYEEWRGLVQRLGEELGQEPAATESGLKGVSFRDA